MLDKNARKTLLIVDDEDGILDITEEYFSRKGYDVYTANNGLEALAVLEAGIDVSCCFTDINMPEMDGLELAEKIRNRDASLPVVVMTGFPSLENSIETLKNGVVDYLIKPVNLEQMELSLRRILRERELFVENLILKEEVERREKLRQLNMELTSKISEVNMLNRIMEDLATLSASEHIFSKVVELSMEVSPADEAQFYILADGGRTLFPVACSRGDSPLTSVMPSERHEMVMTSVKEASPLLVPEVGDDPALSGILSYMAAPLKIRDKVFGVVTASVLDGKKRFEPNNLFYLNFICHKAAAAIENTALYENIYDNLFSTLYAFVAALEARDPYTRRHSNRVADVSVMIARELGCSDEELDVLQFAGQLHDIGKIGIRDDILLKPGRLTREEYEKIKEHPDIGADIVGQLGLWAREQEIIRHHHERYDGKGYPAGIAGEDIPRLARVLSVADAFDAMASDRAYRRKLSKEKVLKIITEESGHQFDPVAVKGFLVVADQAWAGSL